MTFEGFMLKTGLTNEDVIARSKVPRTTLRRFLHGENQISVGRLQELCAITDGEVSLAEIAVEMRDRIAKTKRKARRGARP